MDNWPIEHLRLCCWLDDVLQASECFVVRVNGDVELIKAMIAWAWEIV